MIPAPTLSADKANQATNWHLIKRLLAFSWAYRASCLKVLFLQLFLLTLGLGGLSFIGLGLDVIRHSIDPTTPEPRGVFGLAPPGEWTAMHQVTLLAGLILGMALVRAGLNYYYTVSVGHLVHNQIVFDLRSKVYEKLQSLSFRFFDANASGSIINRVTGDVQALRVFVDGVLIQTVIMILSLIVYITYMVSIHLTLTIACLATLPVLWGITVVFSTKVRPLYMRNRELVDRMILVLSESIQGITTVKGFGREREEREKFLRANEDVCAQHGVIFWLVSLFSPTVGLLTQINIMILLGYGGYLVFQGEIALGSGMVVFAGLLQQFSGQVSNIATIANSVQRSLTGARRVFEILDAPVEIQSKPGAVRLERAKGEVRFENVGFSFKGVDPVLKDISFTARPGQIVAVVGATGAGKSSLMSLIPRFYDPTAGRILLDGHDLRDLDLQDLRRNIGIVFQENFLFSNTVAANISFGKPDVDREAIEKAAGIAAAHDFIKDLANGYDTVLGESGVNLSGGQRQRLALARAILLEPPILLLDDPTAAIDPETEHEILEAMDRATAGRTTFIVAHRLSTLRRADLILVLEHGQLVQTGTHDELYNAPGLYRKLARLQIIDDLKERDTLLTRNPNG
ncbi:MAG: ABC transporter ATP-binding protein [Puniceicoccaceae bacterium]|nr:MAG: ABC transporter ATP-binding protein [Puniceicoccaceae bacterium]